MAASTAKQANVVDLQALSSGAALSAGAASKNASSKHSASNLRAMNSHFGGVVMNENSENGEYAQQLAQHVGNLAVKHGAQSLGASPTIGPAHGLKAMKKQNQSHGNHHHSAKYGGRNTKKTAPTDAAN